MYDLYISDSDIRKQFGILKVKEKLVTCQPDDRTNA